MLVGLSKTGVPGAAIPAVLLVAEAFAGEERFQEAQVGGGESGGEHGNSNTRSLVRSFRCVLALDLRINFREVSNYCITVSSEHFISRYVIFSDIGYH